MNAIEVNHLSKMYRLGTVSTGTLSHDLNRWWHSLRGLEDPYKKIAEANARDSKGDSDYVWSLKDVNFEVKQGEILGIVGRNGAGKSTLLKVLSKVTGPTSGSIKMRGRVASLLEVGTGFHPELTGRENLFLNGAILGMTKREIKKKFDEIVAFSGVERYIDTPVKRYSSGMYVRLAFAVAAHLEPEILIVDEVLAVGDAEFQKKCLGKMKDVSNKEGRTVLFVSHNMAAVKSLCTNAILLENGILTHKGNTDYIISKHIIGSSKVPNFKSFSLGDNHFNLLEVGVRAVGSSFFDPIQSDDKIEFVFKFKKSSSDEYHITIKLKAEDGQYCLVTASEYSPELFPDGTHYLTMQIPAFMLNELTFYADVLVVRNKKHVFVNELDLLSFTVNPEPKPIGSWMGKELGYIRGKFDWFIKDPND